MPSLKTISFSGLFRSSCAVGEGFGTGVIRRVARMVQGLHDVQVRAAVRLRRLRLVQAERGVCF
jgi:hypothetical protein